MTKIKLWYERETPLARLYSKLPSSRGPLTDTDKIWIPKSIIEHTQKWPVKEKECWPEHVVTLPDWFIEKNKL